ncbi:GAF domain-containing protein [Actinoplanes sp. NPDC000266]
MSHAGRPSCVADAGAPVVHGEAVEVMELGAGGLTQDAADALAAVTARAAGVPTAMIHVVDGDHLRLAAGVGLPEGWDSSRRVPVSSTLAGAVFAGQCPLIVDDIDTDVRVPPQAPVREAGFRSYAGFPIRDRNDVVVGVCAVLDLKARRWQAAQLSGVDEGARACAAFVEQQHATQAAEHSRRFLDALLDSLQVGVAAVDASGRLVVTNPMIRQLSGDFPDDGDLRAWARQRLLTAGTGQPLAPDEVPLLRALRGERLRDVEVSAEQPGLPRRTLLTDAQPILGQDGSVRGAVVVARDVTERRRVERLHECELKVSRVLAGDASVPDAAAHVLEALVDGLGWRHAQLWLIDDDADVPRLAAVYDADGDSSEPQAEQLPYGLRLAGQAWQSGQPVWAHDVSREAVTPATGAGDQPGRRTALAVPVASGEHTLAVLVLSTDVVQEPQDLLVKLLRGPVAQIGQFLERRRAQELQLALLSSKEEYLALMGHEMRTPLTSISAYTDLLLELDSDDFDTEGRDLVRVVQRNSDQLRRIVDELLDLAALDNGHATITCQPSDLAALTRDAVARIAGEAERDGQTLTCRSPKKCRSRRRGPATAGRRRSAVQRPAAHDARRAYRRHPG